MSTYFYSATNKNPAITEPGYHDTDFPSRFLEVLESYDPIANGNWQVTLRDYSGKVLRKKVPIKKIQDAAKFDDWMTKE